MTASNRFVRGAFLEGSAMLTFNAVLWVTPPPCSGYCLYGNFSFYTDRGNQTFGVFRRTGSDTPTLSLFLTASS